MLHYAGPAIGPNGPVSASLPPSMPGTMPGGIPNAPPAGGPPPGPMPHAGPSLAALAAIMQRPSGGPNAAQGPPPPPQFVAQTQEDGSVVLRVKNPDGSPGPIVKVLPPMKALGDHPSNPKSQGK
jgi:hypothetical protein